MTRWVGLFCLVVLFAACSGDTSEPEPEALSCVPLVGDDCLTPFPSIFFEKVDPTSPTGYRVTLDPAKMPMSTGGMALRPDRLNQKDGFSGSSPFLVYFTDGVDPTQLPALADVATTVTAASTVQVVEYDSGERVPLYAEVDWWAQSTTDRQALIIYPMRRLKPATRYVVALVGLNNKAGGRLAPAPFVALRDGQTPPEALAPYMARYAEIFAKLTSVGVDRSQLTLAWDVVTASDEQATGQLLQMRDTTLSLIAENMVSYTVDDTIPINDDPDVIRQVNITLKAPSFLDADKKFLKLDSTGRPIVAGFIDAPVTITIPKCAETAEAPIPYLVFGHGLFGSGRDYLGERAIIHAANRMCVILVATDWLGLSMSDLPDLVPVLSDVNNIYVITDRLQQGHVNTLAMTRLFKTKIWKDEALKLGTQVIADPNTGYYLGVSLGGVEGGTFMTLQKDVLKGILAVPGSVWSYMIFRSTNFNMLYPVLDIYYPDALDRQFLVALSQSEWDYSDPAAFASHTIANPLTGTPAKNILVMESMNDAQVPNTATRILVRTMGLVGMDLETTPFAIPTASAPLDSAYTQWDVEPPELPPIENHPLDSDNGAHAAILGIDQVYVQGSAFLSAGGEVISVCPNQKCICPAAEDLVCR